MSHTVRPPVRKFADLPASGPRISDRRESTRKKPGFASRKGEKRVEGLNRSELLMKYGPKVRWIASKMAHQLPGSVDVDDLVSVGFIGLMDAADKFDPRQNVKFGTYAEFRIRGAMLDELRNQDWVPRRVRSRIKAIEKAEDQVQVAEGRHATESEITRKVGISHEVYQNMKNDLGSLTLVNYGSLEEVCDAIESATPNPFEHASRRDTQAMVDKLFKMLSQEERLVMSCYYYRGLSLREIGEIMELTESRISQIHSVAVRKCKQNIKSVVPDVNVFFLMLLDAA